MSNITICLLYYEEPDALSFHFNEMKLAVELGFKYIIIDDGSKEFPISSFHSEIPNSVLIYRINEDIPWNIPGARNLAAHVSETEWILHLDCDLVFDYKSLNKLNKTDLSKNNFYSFGRSGPKAGKPTAGTLLLNKAKFWDSGGYNECFRGSYGYNDPYLKYRMTKNESKEVYLSHIILDDRSKVASNKLSRRGIFKNKIKYYFLRDINLKFLNLHLAFSWEKTR